jgi:hypothetical protein
VGRLDELDLSLVETVIREIELAMREHGMELPA